MAFSIKQIFLDHWSAFLASNTNLNPVIIKEVNKMLSCGDPKNGFALFSCKNCGVSLRVPFRCKSRFCNSCGSAYQNDRAHSISAKLIACRHRHIVFTIPEELRFFFFEDRSLLDILFKASAHVVLSWFASLNKSQFFTPGIVSMLHTFGRDLKWNPHIHMIVSEGASGKLHVWRDVRYLPFIMLRKRWQATLLHFLGQALGCSFSQLKRHLFSNYPQGFYVNAPKSNMNDPHFVSNYITRYIGRPAMAQSRILNYDGSFVTFWYRRHEDNSYKEETLSAFDFINRLIIHIPEQGFNLLRYYGLYAKPFKSSDKLRRLLKRCFVKMRPFLRLWRNRILSSFGYDPLKCSCGHYMQFVSIFNHASQRPP